MANFKQALQAVVRGKLEEIKFSKRLDLLLRQSPQVADEILEELDNAHTTQHLERALYTRLRGKVARVAEETRALTARKSADPIAQARETTDDAPSPAEPGVQDNMDLTLDDPAPLPSVHSLPDAPGPSASSSGWTDASATEESDGEQLGVGSVIKHRFKLLEVLGEGGMGRVYKGIDLLKQEARDRNPYVAIKLLNEDFRQHPEAFISLQRESSRQQKLAHPNIATVYDFDRIGTTGSQVYLTMELLEGVPLNTFIKEKTRPQGGLPFEKAFPMIQDLGLALAYAHNQNIVHSDFKPGNSFLCKDGNVKVLDFGIARAAKNPITGDSEKTLFDPGKLGALTPAYASLEMLEGEEPDPRDDIYAMGCVAYELLTGKHPFNKMPATVALENKLSPPMVKGLKGKQNRALKRSVTFHRKDRSPTVESFVEELEGKAHWQKNPVFIGIMVLFLAAGIAFFPVRDYLHTEEVRKTIAQMQESQDYVGVVLERLPSYSEQDRKTILDEARMAIQQSYENKVNYAIQTTEGRYNFGRAEALLTQVRMLYPDSRWLSNFAQKVQSRKDQLLYELNKRYLGFLEDPSGVLENQDQISEILGKIEQISPGHALLKDQRRVIAYWEVARGELNKGNYQLALQSVDSGLEIAPTERTLLNLRGKIERDRNIAALEKKILDAQPHLRRLEDYRAIEKDVTELVSLAPGNEAVARLALQTQDVLQEKVSEIRTSGSRADAQKVVGTYGNLLSALQFGRELSELKLLHLSGPERGKVIKEILGESQDNINRLLQNPMLNDPDWQSDLRASLQQLSALLPPDDSLLSKTHKTIASIHISAADKLLEEQRFEEAINLIQGAALLAPDVAVLKIKEQEIRAADLDFHRQKKEEQRLAELESKKQALQVALQAKTPESVMEARGILKELKRELPAGDPYLGDKAPGLFETAYLGLAKADAKNRDFTAALQTIQKALEVAPDSANLKQLERAYRIENDIAKLGGIFREGFDFSAASIQETIQSLEQEAPSRYAKLRSESVQILEQRVQALLEQQPAEAGDLLQQALTIFPGASALTALRDSFASTPWENQEKAELALQHGNLSEARELLGQAPEDNPGVDPFRERLEDKIQEANNAKDEFLSLLGQAGNNQEKLKEAKLKLQIARLIWKDNPAFSKEWVDLGNRIRGLSNRPTGIRRQEGDLFEQAEPAPASPAPRPAPEARPETRPEAGPSPAEPTSAPSHTRDPEAASGAAPTPSEAPATQADNQAVATLREPAPTPETPAPWQPIPSPAECNSRLAGYGKRVRAVCYDMISDRFRGPDLVVVPAGGSFTQPFAIGKYEISIHDHNKYCVFSKSCKVLSGDKNNPLTGVSIQFVDNYLKWLSERSGNHYRLPTSTEWEYAARANGMTDTQVSAVRRNLNCQVVQNNQVLKGMSALSVRSGTTNAWGLSNYLGNVQELVRDSDSLSARGGSHKDSLQDCQVSLSHAQDGTPNPITGFRVLREEVY